MMPRVLIVDDERKMRRVLQILLEQLGMESVPSANGTEALVCFGAEKIDLVLTDLKMPGMSGVELLSRIRAVDPDVPVIVLTAHGTVQTAVEAMKQGAFDYILKPFDVQAIELIIRNALEMGRYRTENRFLKAQVPPTSVFENLVGGSAAMRTLYEMIRQVAPAKSSVLITGETGTGKELVARAIHNLSLRRDKLFVPLNCAAIPQDLLESELFGHVRGAFTGAQAERTGKFELADGGTLFLDEIGDMAYPLQAKLLRVLQEGVIERIGSNKPVQIDVRVLSSTNRDLSAAIRDGTFREDLYYRLNVFRIHLPPLRERCEDISDLAEFFLAVLGREMGKSELTLGPDAATLLAHYPWPGNVRELRNLMERAAVLCSGPLVDGNMVRLLLPAVATHAAPEADAAAAASENLQLEPAVEEVERKLILRALGVANDNKAEAARLLGVSERTLWYKLKRYAL
jgi:two-component system, NtrC family, response regulator AtoC